VKERMAPTIRRRLDSDPSAPKFHADLGNGLDDDSVRRLIPAGIGNKFEEAQ
jgi:hypothetical protein